MSNSRSPRAVRSITIGISGISPHPIGRVSAAVVLTLAALAAVLALARRAPASPAHAGGPPDQHLIMDGGPAGRHNTLVGRPGLHNWILGGYGNDTIYGRWGGGGVWG